MLGRDLGSARHAAATRPQLKVCYLCGQQFGTASIAIHVPQCYAKKVAQWQVGNPQTRGPHPKHPDTVDWKGSKGQSAKKLNDEQFSEFQANLVPCPNCARTFLPDRLPVHLRGCKGGRAGASAAPRPSTQNGAARSTSLARSTASDGSGRSRAASRGASTSPARRPAGMRMLLPTCYLCGQQFGTASIAIHVPQCYAKKLAQWQAGDPHTRGKAPRHPDEVNWRLVDADKAVGGGGGDMSMEEQCEAQFQEFINNLEPCPNCGRKFLSDRLAVHLRSCRPGHTAKRVGASPGPGPAASGATAGGEMAAETARAPRPPSHQQPASEGRPSQRRPRPEASASEKASESAELDRVDPRRNRVPKDSCLKLGTERACPRCTAVEHDATAKYCRECGWNLNSRLMLEPCARCHEAVPEGTRFCSTCGDAVNGAAAHERVAGDENANAPTVRMTVCPACRAVCDADGNFCDNCGAALGAAEPGGGGGPSSSDSLPSNMYMYCQACDQSVSDLTAVYCEDCGGKLQRMERVRGSGDGSQAADRHHAVGTLRPEPNGSSGSGGRTRRPGDSAADPLTKRTQPAHQKQATPVPPAPESGGYDGGNAVVEELDRVACDSCGRRFTPDALARHAKVCGRAGKQRPVFNMTKQRLADCEMPATAARVSPNRGRSAAAAVKAKATGDEVALAPPTKDWRAESRAFRAAMRDARRVEQVMKGGGDVRDLPPPTYSENAHYVPCPHCQRRFAPDVAERHIPRCANTVNRPKPPPRRR